jgi:hypothetical protein
LASFIVGLSVYVNVVIRAAKGVRGVVPLKSRGTALLLHFTKDFTAFYAFSFLITGLVHHGFKFGRRAAPRQGNNFDEAHSKIDL